MFYIAILFEMARKFLFSGGLRDLKWYRTGLKEKDNLVISTKLKM